MNIEELREYCLTVKGSGESFPFSHNILVFKIMEKMFAYIDLSPKDGIFRVNLKCDPERSVELREQYTSVIRGTHDSGFNWNAIAIHGDLSDEMIRKLIDHSADEVIKKLTKSKREEYMSLFYTR